MPKSPASPLDDGDGKDRGADIVAKKKKNADAQAAFRQRRATYIASLEETVVSLEGVVVQLQDSCREHKAETDLLQQEVTRLKHEGREREKMWKALWYAERTRQHPGRADEPPPIPDSTLFGAVPVSPTITAQVSPAMNHSSSSYHSSITDNSSGSYGSAAYPVNGYPGSTSSHGYAASHGDYRTHPHHHLPPLESTNRYVPYGSYMMPPANHMRDSSSWQTSVSPTDSAAAPGTTPPVQSPMAYSDPSNMMYGPRYMMPEQPQAMGNVDVAGYVVEHSPSNSAPSTPISTSSAPVNTGYNYGLMESQEQHTAAYTRAPSHGISMTLHGGLADVSASLSSSRAYRQPAKLSEHVSSFSVQPQSPTRTMANPADLPQDPKGLAASTRPRDTPSRSPSPTNDQHVSSTLAVIKQQAFGTMRRSNRTRSKVSTTNAKKAIEKLEMRGADLGLRRLPKRQRTDSDDDDGR